MVLSRRRFMLLLGGATTGLWLASTGLVRLERNFVLSLAGSCSFCGKDRAEVNALLGSVGRSTMICDECVGLCCEILAAEFDEEPRRAAAPRPSRQTRQARHGVALDELRRAIQGNHRRAWAEFACSFCDAHRQTVRRLITGPRVFICDRCVGDATAVVAHVLRA